NVQRKRNRNLKRIEGDPTGSKRAPKGSSNPRSRGSKRDPAFSGWCPPEAQEAARQAEVARRGAQRAALRALAEEVADLAASLELRALTGETEEEEPGARGLVAAERARRLAPDGGGALDVGRELREVAEVLRASNGAGGAAGSPDVAERLRRCAAGLRAAEPPGPGAPAPLPAAVLD
ncbi:unnamed protein product, partial [Effrenium voratum]